MNMARDSFTGYATGDAMRQVDDAVELATQRRERFAQAEQRIDQLVVTEQSPDGAVRATVRSSGALLGIELSELVRTIPPRQLASLIETCVQRAQAGVAQRVGDILNEAMPGDPLTEELVANARKALVPQQVQRQPAAPAAGPGTMAIGGIQDAGLPRPPRRPRRPAGDEDEEWAGQSFMVRGDGRR